MTNMIFALTANESDFGDRASIAGIVTLQGMLTIFAVLAILWAAIEIMHHLLYKGEKKPKKDSSVPKSDSPAPNAEDAAIAAAIAATLAAGDDGATVAAITAAISAMRAEQGNTGSFRVVSFKRANTANHRKF